MLASSADILRSLVQLRFGGHSLLKLRLSGCFTPFTCMYLSLKMHTKYLYDTFMVFFSVSGVGFEPTPTFVDQNAPTFTHWKRLFLSLAP